jgi:hypothetical protein
MLEVWSGTGLIAIYAGVAVAVIQGRRSGSSAHARYRMPWYPLWPLITIGRWFISRGPIGWTWRLVDRH